MLAPLGGARPLPKGCQDACENLKEKKDFFFFLGQERTFRKLPVVFPKEIIYISTEIIS